MNSKTILSLSQSGDESDNTFQGLTLSEWIFVGQETGRIKKLETVVLTRRMRECEVLSWIADIVLGRVSEETELLFMRRVLENVA